MKARQEFLICSGLGKCSDMRGVKKPNFSVRFRKNKFREKTPKTPNISRNLVLFRFPTESENTGNTTKSPSLQVSSHGTPSTLHSPPESSYPEYFVKNKYSLYRTGLGRKHLSQPNSTHQPSRVGAHKHGSHVSKDLKRSRPYAFGNKVLINDSVTSKSPESDNTACFRKSKKLKSELCYYFTRFGVCNDKQCRFVHDPEKVFVCRKFISGSCIDPNCTLLHTTEKDRLPVCLRFLSGLCGKEDCPFVHVNVGKNAEICKDFVFKGFCSQGRFCSKLHTWDCVEFWKTGRCSKTETCPLRHKMCVLRNRS
ncbi:hypothetical protein GAYE_SCF02G2104 [Galdieria yellowstonensis]|uniref:C3H1-type domain-containing protein n=1 Tax=Galdieria yellowstonensis TaxID=3028027 RepID=A0AAV9I9V0_9RHOD|nr:hypothetical protein GAYE_SCF02G2104 [Galdieria yellowstonensis]